jgi:hypothetical protein
MIEVGPEKRPKWADSFAYMMCTNAATRSIWRKEWLQLRMVAQPIWYQPIDDWVEALQKT